VNTIATVGSDQAMALGPSSPTWHFRLRAARGYDTAVRVLGVCWFFALAVAVTLRTITHVQSIRTVDFSPIGWSTLLSSICLMLFYLTLCWLVLLRPLPVARIDAVLPSIIAFAGTYFPWSIVLFGPVEASVSQQAASAVLLLIGTVSMVGVIIHLGRSFSIVPQASKLVRTGPYSFVRNPLYLAEEVALLGTLLQFYSLVTLGLFLAHGALQIRRIFYEENLLRQTFPDYDNYAKSTKRLIPHVW
jgi:protein-S-isoprenylcysteine O-methyltransferase Ste14